jgi:putative FmdB family regulatory protein
MPIYEYRCADCERHFERYVATAGAAATCPTCGSAQVKRMLSLFAMKSDGGSPVASTVPAGGGACCGGGCACH